MTDKKILQVYIIHSTTADTKFHVTSVSRKKRVLYGEKIIVHAHMNVPRKKIPSARSPSKGN